MLEGSWSRTKKKHILVGKKQATSTKKTFQPGFILQIEEFRYINLPVVEIRYLPKMYGYISRTVGAGRSVLINLKFSSGRDCT